VTAPPTGGDRPKRSGGGDGCGCLTAIWVLLDLGALFIHGAVPWVLAGFAAVVVLYAVVKAFSR
jgi:hypothetical protein